MPNKGVIILHFLIRCHKCTCYASVPQRRKTYTEKQAGMPWHNTRLTCSLRCLHLTIETTRTEKLPNTLWVHKKRQSVWWILCKITKKKKKLSIDGWNWQITWATTTKNCSFGIINQTKIPYRKRTMFISLLWLNWPQANEEIQNMSSSGGEPVKRNKLAFEPQVT